MQVGNTIKKGPSDSSLIGAYKNFVKNGYKKSNADIQQWRINKLKPQFRQSLKNRIAMTNKLLQLKKEDMDGYTKKQQRRLIINESITLISEYNKIIANNYQAIAFIWRGRQDLKEAGNPANGRKVDDRSIYHGNHWSRNNKMYFYLDSWAIRQEFINTRARGFKWARFPDGYPGEPINCRCWAYNIFDIYKIPTRFLTPKGKLYLKQNNRR